MLGGGLADVLRRSGHHTEQEAIYAPEGFRTEISTSFALYRQLTGRVRAAHVRERFPLVLAGNCGAAVGVVAGLPPQGLGVVWLDSHGDFNTPDTSESGFLDGMGLAILTGQCWHR